MGDQMKLPREDSLVEGVVVKPLAQIPDKRGRVMHMLRCDDPLFKTFGEVYFSEVLPGCVKAWKRHLRMTQHFAVPRGAVQIVLYDDRPESPSKGAIQSVAMGENDYCLVTVPPLVWYGFKSASRDPSLIANCTDIAHDPSESERSDPSEGRVPYQWAP